MKKITKHGWKSIETKGNVCPECDSVNTTMTWKVLNVGGWFCECNTCGCRWEIIEDRIDVAPIDGGGSFITEEKPDWRNTIWDIGGVIGDEMNDYLMGLKEKIGKELNEMLIGKCKGPCVKGVFYYKESKEIAPVFERDNYERLGDRPIFKFKYCPRCGNKVKEDKGEGGAGC